jgi:hypothetical protein
LVPNTILLLMVVALPELSNSIYKPIYVREGIAYVCTSVGIEITAVSNKYYVQRVGGTAAGYRSDSGVDAAPRNLLERYGGRLLVSASTNLST